MIKVGYCIAYDWYFLNYSIPQVYEEADLICLSLDKSRKSWSGQSFNWDQEAFEAMIKRLDVKNKIQIFEADFFIPELSPMQNEVRQRNMIADFMGIGGWHIQLDADEYFVEFNRFVQFLRKFKSSRKVNICCPLLNLYKQLPEGFLWIKPDEFSQIEFIQIATQYPHYEHGRRNGYFNILTEYAILHQSWARTDAEVWEKLNNWGHKLDFDISKYYRVWMDAAEENYATYKNFHHIKPEVWPKLEWVSARSIESMLAESKNNFQLPIRKSNLKMANSIWSSRLKKLYHLLISKSA
jgi:hypothetical protein